MYNITMARLMTIKKLRRFNGYHERDTTTQVEIFGIMTRVTPAIVDCLLTLFQPVGGLSSSIAIFDVLDIIGCCICFSWKA